MSAGVRELLPLYALGVLEGEEANLVERAVNGDARLSAELAAYHDTAGAIASVVRPVPPPPEILTRLLASTGGGRFESFAARMAKLFDVTVERARELLGLIERPASWVPQIPGISLVHFDGGPQVAAADCGFVRITPGTFFPPHTHLGEELVTVLCGQMHDIPNDKTVGPGEDYLQTEGTTHYLQCLGSEDCIYASRATNGISAFGSRLRPYK